MMGLISNNVYVALRNKNTKINENFFEISLVYNFSGILIALMLSVYEKIAIQLCSY